MACNPCALLDASEGDGIGTTPLFLLQESNDGKSAIPNTIG